MALTKEQVEARRTRIGGSDAAAICGKDPYRTAYEVALRITGQLEPDQALADQDQILFGNEMEGVLARIYERKHGVELYVPDTVVHPQYPFLAVNIDRRIKGRPEIGLEMKNTGQFVQDAWGQPGTDQVPERVILQCSHAMMICPEIQVFHVLQCYGGNQFRQYVVPRNQQLIDALLAIELEFMRNVQAGVIPEPDWTHRSTSDTLRRAFRKIEGTIEARPDLVHWTQAHEEAQAELKRVTTLADAVKNHISHLMGNAEVALLPDGRKWVRRLVKRAGYTVEDTEFIETRLVKPRAKGEQNGSRS